MKNEGVPTNLRLKPNIGFGLGILVLIASAWLSYANANKFAESNQWVTHTYEVLATTTDMMANLDDIETGQRGYVITGKEEYLDPYRTGVARIDGVLAKFKELTLDNPRQQRRFDEIKPLVAARLEVAGETVHRNGRGLGRRLDELDRHAFGIEHPEPAAAVGAPGTIGVMGRPTSLRSKACSARTSVPSRLSGVCGWKGCGS